MATATQNVTVSVQAPPAGSPSYVSSMTPYRWYNLTGSSTTTPDLGLSATNVANAVAGNFTPFSTATVEIWRTWSGFVVVPSYGQFGSLFCTGGGHTSNNWPGFFVFDLNTRTWAKDSRGVPSTTTVDSNGMYTNGAPHPSHTRYNPQCRTSTGEIILPTVEVASASSRVCFRRYSTVNGTWAGGATQLSMDTGSGGGAIYDPVSDRSVYRCHQNAGNAYYDHATETVAAYSYPDTGYPMPSALLPAVNGRTRAYMLAGVYTGASTAKFQFIDVLSPTSGVSVNASPTGLHSGMSGLSSTGGYDGMNLFYSPAQDAIYVTGKTPTGLQELWKYPCPSSVPGTWTGQQITVSSQSTMEDFSLGLGNNGYYTHNKARLATFPDGKEMLVLSGYHTHAVYGMRIN